MAKGFDKRTKVQTLWFDLLFDGRKILLGRSLEPTPQKPRKGYFFVGTDSLVKAYGFDLSEMSDCIGAPLDCVDAANGKGFKAWDVLDFGEFVEQKSQEGNLTAIKLQAASVFVAFQKKIEHDVQRAAEKN